MTSQFAPLDLGEILLRTTRLAPEQLDRIREEQETTHQSLAEVLVERGLLESHEVLNGLGELLGLEVREDILLEDIDLELATKIPITFAKQNFLLPVAHTEDQRLLVATARPLATGPLDDLRLFFNGVDIKVELATEQQILRAINRVYDQGQDSTGSWRRPPKATWTPSRPRSATNPRTYSKPLTMRRSSDWSTRCCNMRSRSVQAIFISSPLNGKFAFAFASMTFSTSR